MLADINQRDEWWINYPVYQAYLKGAVGLIAVQMQGYGEVDDEALNAQDIAVTLGEVLEHGLPTVESNFTKKLFKNYTPEEVVGKSIKDKRGGENNIHSWEIELKGSTSKEERTLLNLMLRERRKKKWAEEIGIDWMDGNSSDA